MVAVGTKDAGVSTRTFTAGRNVLAVEGGEMGAGALIACRGPGSADVGGVAPFEARRTLTSSGGGRPRLASSRDADKGDGRLQ